MLSLKNLKIRSKCWMIVRLLILLLILLSFSNIVIADCADLDADGVINTNDEIIIKGQWHEKVDCCNKIKCGDINCDGFVDLNDLLFWSKRTNIKSDCSEDYELFVEVISSTSRVVNAQLEDSVFTIELENPEGVLGVTNIRTNERPTRAIINEVVLQKCNGQAGNCWGYEDNILTLNYDIPKTTIKLYFRDFDFILVLFFIAILVVIIIILLVTHRPVNIGKEELKKKKAKILFPNMPNRGFNQ